MVTLKLEKLCRILPGSGANWKGDIRYKAYKIIDIPHPPNVGFEVKVSEDITFRIRQLTYDASKGEYIALDIEPSQGMCPSHEQYIKDIGWALGYFSNLLKSHIKAEWRVEYLHGKFEFKITGESAKQ